MALNPKNNTTSTLEQVAQDIWNEYGYTICAEGYEILSKGEVVATLTPFSTDNGSDVGMCACDAVEIVFNELGGVFTNNPRFVEISKRHCAVDPDMDSDAGRQIYSRFCNDLIAANRNMDPHPDGLRQRIMAVFKDLMSRRLVAPDLIYWQKTSSSWFGLDSHTEEYVQKVPHTITPSDVAALQYFFGIVAAAKLAELHGIRYEYPTLPGCKD